VCRHAQNDLHTTTNILLTPLAPTCIHPFTPATFDASGNLLTPASAECRTSELTLAEFKSLRGKMDSFDPAARTAEEFQGGTPSFRTELYTGRDTLMSLRDSIELNERNGVKHTPELKGPVASGGDPATINAIFGSQEAYAQRAPGGQRQPRRPLAAGEGLPRPGIRHHHLDLRAGRSTPGRVAGGLLLRLRPDGCGDQEGQLYKALDVLAREVKIIGIFSDWPATVTYYANCMNLK
jgi:hypothetical protein